jgi:hypothetical protein
MSFPWWMLQGSTPEVETSTKMLIIPPKLITTISSQEVIAGHLAFMPDLLISMVTLIPILTLIGCILIFLFALKSRGILLFAAMAFIISGILIFYFGVTNLTQIGVGSFLGDGYLEVGIPGEERDENIFCSWGPFTGFYLHLASLLPLLISLFMRARKETS